MLVFSKSFEFLKLLEPCLKPHAVVLEVGYDGLDYFDTKTRHVG